ncbi:MAG: hypothetical protein KGL39_39920 [Patescibacteria group bacterium]|nr:hypothetical protein [Patescibacteria group bacterium]
MKKLPRKIADAGIITAVGLLAIALAAAAYFLTVPETIVAKVGSASITDGQISEYIAMKKCYGATYSRSTALASLVNNDLQEQVLSGFFNLSPTIQDLSSAARQIGRNTKDPTALACIKTALGGESGSAYLNIFVSPTIINPALYGNFSLSPKINAIQMAQINLIFAEVQKGVSLQSFPEYQKFNVPIKPSLPANISAAGFQPSQNNLARDVLQKMKPGEVWPKVIENDSAFEIIRLLGEGKSNYHVDGIVINKPAFDPWFQAYVKANVPIKIINKQLLAGLNKDYSSLWWLK